MFRLALPLAVLAAAGHALAPGFPRYQYNPTPGDAYGYYFALREILATCRREATLLVPGALAALVFLVLVSRRLRHRPARLETSVVVAVWGVGVLLAVVATSMHSTGAGTIGWPLVWSIPLLPYRALGLPLDPGIAFGVGLAISIVCNIVTVFAVFVLGRLLVRRNNVALLAAGTYALWPLAALLVEGVGGTQNGTWQNDLGLSLYTEPLSTAVIATALVCAARSDSDGSRADLAACLAGALLGFSVVIRLSNIVILLVVLAWIAWRSRRRLLWAVPAAAGFAPVVLAYWRKGYFDTVSAGRLGSGDVVPAHTFALANISNSWHHSLLWRPPMLALLVPLAIVGCLAVAGRAATLLALPALANAVFYSPYKFTALHPRFLFVGLPPVIVLWAAGVCSLASQIRTVTPRMPAQPDRARARVRKP
jgi:hypothetical protein